MSAVPPPLCAADVGIRDSKSCDSSFLEGASIGHVSRSLAVRTGAASKNRMVSDAQMKKAKKKFTKSTPPG